MGLDGSGEAETTYRRGRSKLPREGGGPELSRKDGDGERASQGAHVMWGQHRIPGMDPEVVTIG